jgi:hypothetical protein
MIRSKRYAGGLLLAGLVLAVGTPIYLGLAAPHLSVYLLNPFILLCQPVPYLACAGLWLPWRARAAARIALILAGLLLLAALVLTYPCSGRQALRAGHDRFRLHSHLYGDHSGLFLASAIAALSLWLRVRGRRALSVNSP